MGNTFSIFENCIEIVKKHDLQDQENKNTKKNIVYDTNDIVYDTNDIVYDTNDIVYAQKNIFDDAEYIF